MSVLEQMIQEIREGLTKTTSSVKDEVTVMKQMLNDKEYRVDIYDKSGITGSYCPSESAREIISSAMVGAARMNTHEANQLADEYEFSGRDAQNMISISKEFVNTYMQTGRKLPLGGRETCDVSLVPKHVEAHESSYPKKVGVDDAGNDIYEKQFNSVPSYNTVKIEGSCPSWLKK
ncbi:MAG: hypothetical protein ACRCXT_10500 [Paraclostridium sp.]